MTSAQIATALGICPKMPGNATGPHRVGAPTHAAREDVRDADTAILQLLAVRQPAELHTRRPAVLAAIIGD